MIVGNKNFMRRLAKLEAGHVTEETFPKSYVLWDDDPIPEGVRERDLVVRLASKAPSPEAWAAQVRSHHPEWFQPRAPQL